MIDRVRELGTAMLLLGVLMGVGGCSDDPKETQHLTIDDLPECSPVTPSFDCVNRIFQSLRETEWPFDKMAVDRAYDGDGTEVLPGWKLTALHVLDSRPPTDLKPDCYGAAFEFAEPGKTIVRSGCGTFLFIGGHPQSAACKSTGEPMVTCVDKVPVAETFDIGLVATAPSGTTLDVRTDVEVGEEVFIVGNPSFLGLLTPDEMAWMEPRYPLVSAGRVLELDGRGMVLSNLALPGNSGGPVLDKNGRVVGVVYTKIILIRDHGVATNPAHANHRTVAVRIDGAMKARMDAEASASRAFSRAQ